MGENVSCLKNLKYKLLYLQQLSQCYLHMLREISGVRRCTPTPILLAEFGIKSLPDQWLLRAAGFWNSLASLPIGNVSRHVALDACSAAISQDHRNWAHSMFKAIRGIGYQLNIRCDDLDHIDMSALSLMLTQRRDAVWDGLDICPRTCPSFNAKLCTYATWFARPVEQHARSLLDLPVSRRCMQRFPRFRMGCHRLPRDTGAWVGIPRLHRVCNIRQHRTIGDEKHLVFECPALQDLRDKRPHLFDGAQTNAMVLFMWQDDITGVVRFIDECLERSSTHLISPEMAGKDVMNLSLSLCIPGVFREHCKPQYFCSTQRTSLKS